MDSGEAHCINQGRSPARKDPGQRSRTLADRRSAVCEWSEGGGARMKRTNHRKQVLKQARISLRKGRFVVPVPQGRKGPILKNWTQLRLTAEQAPEYFAENDNIGWIAGDAS